MAFLRTLGAEDFLAPIVGPDITLRAPAASDYIEWAELRAKSRSHLVPWEPAWPRDDLSRAMFRRRLKAYARDVRDDIAYSFFLFGSAGSAPLMGGLTLSNVRRGASQTATLGYWMGAPYVGQGYMKTAVQMIMPFAFRHLQLHRLEAATMISNAPSIGVLEATGFVREGRVRSYLKINGQWEDHFLFARLATDDPNHVTTIKGMT